MDWATAQIVIVIALVILVFFGFVRERMPSDIVALCAVAVLLISGILSTNDVLAVFSNSAPITIAAMFVLSAGLERTGVIDTIARLVSRQAGASPGMALLTMMVGVMVLSAFINNTPVVVILTPVVIGLARTLGLAPSKLLIPLSFATIFGGTTTLIGTSTNILVDGVTQKLGLAPLGMFEITGAGALLGLIGTIYMVTIGRWLLPDRESLATMLPNPGERHFIADLLVPLGSPLVGKKLKEAGFTEARGLRVIDVIRNDRMLSTGLDDTELQANDRIVVRSRIGDMLALREAGNVAFGGSAAHAIEPIDMREIVIMEGVVGPQSRMLGRRVAELNLRRLYGGFILALHRQGVGVTGNFDDMRLHMGDTLLLEGPPESMKRLFDNQELVNLMQPSERPLRRTKAPIAAAAVILVMGLAAFEVLPIAALAIIAATGIVALRCLDAEEAYGSVRWNILMLIFGMLALGTAMEKTGTAKLVVEQFSHLIAGLGPIVTLSAIYFITSMLTEIMSNNATAILLTPIAVGVAQQMGVDPRPFAVAVLFAASASFATPIGYQTNTFVYNAGGYKFMDFVKVGLPLNLLLWIASTFIIPIFWPLTH